MSNLSLLEVIRNLAHEAGEEILKLYLDFEKVSIKTKADASPLTTADMVSHEIIVNGLNKLTPNIPILSEESPSLAFSKRASWEQYWLVDPLDGTKEFINKTDEFTINISLIENHESTLGLIYAPALAVSYFACKGEGAFRQKASQLPQQIHTRSLPSKKIIVAASRRHGVEQLQGFLKQVSDYVIVHRGSALKCGLVAEGTADVYPRFGPTSEWDIAAGHCVLKEAGGEILDLAGKTLCYNTKDSLENPSFLAIGDLKGFRLRFPIP